MIKDIYFLDNYIKIYEDNNEGILETFNFDSKYGRCIYKYLKRPIEYIEGELYFDIATAYGYGGPLFLDYKEENIEKLVEEYRIEFEKYCIENKIVSEFIRFHPLIENNKYMENHMDVSYIRDTVYIDLSNKEDIFKNMKQHCKTAVRKAIKNDVIVEQSKDLNTFIDLYRKTMTKNNAKEYYFFNDKFFENTIKYLGENVKIFNAIKNGKVISSAIIINYGDYIHYHLIGNDQEYSNYRPSNLLIYEVSLWGYNIGAKYFHLGGGYIGNDDTLFRFKKNFNPNGIKHFYIGKKIHIDNIYQNLVDKYNSNKESNYFPLYRDNEN